MNPILVAGTNSWENDERVDWFCPGHPFGGFLKNAGVPPTYDGLAPFVWSTDLDGVPGFTRKNLTDWAAGGAALAYFVVSAARQRAASTAVIAHSHGLQVALFACARHNLKIKTLISVGSPVREDMMTIAKQARLNIGYWLHIHSDNSDRWQWFGELFDGAFGIVREHPLADKNDFVAKVGHSELLRVPAQFHHWVDRQWVDSLKG